MDKTAGTPENAFIDNGDITEKKVDSRLDRNWYLELAEKRIKGLLVKKWLVVGSRNGLKMF